MEETMRKEFRYGKKIQEFRKQQEWTQEQLAEAAGLDRRTIQRVEGNQTRNSETLQSQVPSMWVLKLSAQLCAFRNPTCFGPIS
jgi:DNA-binding XRE family transcriptional regulator